MYTKKKAEVLAQQAKQLSLTSAARISEGVNTLSNYHARMQEPRIVAVL